MNFIAFGALDLLACKIPPERIMLFPWESSPLSAYTLSYESHVFFYRLPLLELVAASQTDSAVDAAMNYLKDVTDYRIAERFVMATSFASHPRESLLKALLVRLLDVLYL